MPKPSPDQSRHIFVCGRLGQETALLPKLEAYLSLGHDLNEVATRLTIKASDQLRASGRALTFRDRVLSGLARKIHGSLRALLDDSRAQRLEAMHHLKTMAEAFIYFHVVIKDDTARTAELVLAEATLHQKVLYLRDNPTAAGDIQEWQELRDLFRGDGKLDARVGNLAKAHSAELGTWYSQVYRLACEPAHLGDLLEFMPNEDDNTIAVVSPPTAAARAQIALHYGTAIVLAMLRAINEGNDMGLSVPLGDFEQRFQALSQPPPSAA